MQHKSDIVPHAVKRSEPLCACACSDHDNLQTLNPRHRNVGLRSVADRFRWVCWRARRVVSAAVRVFSGFAFSACASGAVDITEIEATAANCPDVSAVLLAGTDRQLVGINAYYLQEEATRALRRGESQSAVVEEVFEKAKQLGARYVRCWAFNDGPEKAGDSAIQIDQFTYDEDALRGMDLVLTRAMAHGIKVILPLGNYWDDYGGARQYVAWSGEYDPKQGDSRFFTSPSVVAHYKEHIRRLLARKNTFDAIPYAEHPAVLAWELLNEPRGDGLSADGAQMRRWVDDIAAHIKSLAPQTLVGTGEEGFDSLTDAFYDTAFWRAVSPPTMWTGRSRFAENTRSPHVDYATAHFFPEAWGIETERIPEAGARWIAEHAALARSVGKPFVLGEFGLRNDGAFALNQRRATYRGWLRCAQKSGVAAISPWLFHYDTRPDDWDRYAFYFKNGTTRDDTTNRYADLFFDATH